MDKTLVVLALLLIAALGASVVLEKDEKKYPTPQVLSEYKSGTIITGNCEGFGPDCIDYSDLTPRQKSRCFTFRDDTFDPFCSRIRVPMFAILPEVNDFLMEGATDPRLRVKLRQCVDVRTSCYYPITIRGVDEHPCRELRKIFDRMLDMIESVPTQPSASEPVLEYPGCSNHGAVARLNSTLRDPAFREQLQEPDPSPF
ncbi:MAG TPA: hypothetical protein VIF43_01715 [Patescibacteria group bacterium]|jgi:hypothetical protein